MNVKTLKNEIQLELELNAMAQPAVDAAARADQAAAGAVTIATNAGNEAKDIANAAAALAQEASGNANAAATRVDEAIALAQRAAQHAQDTADSVNDAAARAETATATANTAADAANNAASRTQNAIENAQYAATGANNASSQASAAASNATAAMKTANNAASLANTAATSANHAAEDALAAAGAANNAANNANVAAKTASDMTTALENVHPQAVAATEAANAAAQNANTVAQNASAAVNKVVSDGNAAIESVKDVAADTLAAGEAVRSIYEVKADAITDTSAKAASHSLHAQDGRLAVTLYGKTTETGTGDKSPDNPYVISGVDAANIQACGKNLINVGTVTFTTSRRIFLNAPLPPGTYTVSALCTSDGTDRDTCRFYFCAANNKELKQVDFARGSRASATVTIREAAYNILLTAETSISLSTGDTATFADVQIEFGSTATAYEPYTANVITPAILPDGAPLMGNGTVDDTIENDVLSGCDKKIVLNGSESWAFWDKFFYLKLPDSVGNAAFCDRYFNASASTYTGAIDINPNTKELRINSGHTSAADFKAYFAANPLTVFYRSTDYTPENDLRVCKITRRFTKVYAKDLTIRDLSATPGVVFLMFTSGQKLARNAADNAVYSNDYAAKPGGWAAFQAVNNSFYVRDNQAGVRDDNAIGTLEEVRSYFAASDAYFIYQLATPETYMTDPLPLRKPTGIMPVTVTGSAETAVTYPHETKHYIDQKFDALAAALLS